MSNGDMDMGIKKAYYSTSKVSIAVGRTKERHEKQEADETRIGLTDIEVKESRARYGENVLSPAPKKSFFKSFIENLGDPVIKVLLIALGLNILFMFRNADWFETCGIALSVFLATLISTLSEQGSAAAFEKLSEECGRSVCRVYRNGKLHEIPISELVVGDTVKLEAGEMIPADGALMHGMLTVDQSSMTGEGEEVTKLPSKRPEAHPLPSDKSSVFRGCTVLSGSGEMTVVSVGDKTFIGGISREVQADTRESPLKRRLTKLATQISRLGYAAAFLVSVIYLINTFLIDSHFDTSLILQKLTDFRYVFESLFKALTLGLTVIVVAVPEGLPMMIAVVLSSNIKRMVKDNVLVRKPVGIESAGSMNILFTDKTGTLTEGKPSLSSLVCPDSEVVPDIRQLKKKDLKLYELFLQSTVFNTSSEWGADGTVLGGNSGDRALLRAVPEDICRGVKAHERISWQIEFDSTRKFSAVGINGKAYIKGAPEMLLKYAKGSADGGVFKVNELTNRINSISKEGGRVILICTSSASYADISEGRFGELYVICAAVLSDKLRKEASKSVSSLKRAGIHVVMMTGDSSDTASSIANACGIIDKDHNAVIDGARLRSMSDKEISELLPRLAVISRALPQDKSRLVRITENMGLVVGMTGDGINDAPALRLADVGFSMGSGTQVAREAGDIIIVDNDLASIVKAVLYGRNIFKSIRKFITLQLLMNFCAVGVSMICPFIGIDAPVTVVQMLWINIIMDTLGGLAFSGEGASEYIMSEPPKTRDEPILNRYMIDQILIQGGATVVLCLLFLFSPRISSHFRSSVGSIYLLTAFFAFFIFTSVLNCFNARSDRLNLFSGITKNPRFVIIMCAVLFIQILFVYLGGDVLRTAPLTVREMLYTCLLSLSVIPCELIRKLFWRIRGHKTGY